MTRASRSASACACAMSVELVIWRKSVLSRFSRRDAFAATVGFAEFDYLTIYAKRLGFDLMRAFDPQQTSAAEIAVMHKVPLI
jgi:hypothetical protein